MKQHLSKLTSLFLITALMASVLAEAISAFVLPAKADGESVLYFNDFISYVKGLDTYSDLSVADQNVVDNFLSSCSSYIEDTDKQVLIMRYGVAFTLLVIGPSSGNTITSGGYVTNNQQWWYLRDTSWYGYCLCYGYLRANDLNMTYNMSPGSFLGRERSQVINIASSLDYNQAWFSPYEYNTYDCYCSKDIVTLSGYDGFSFGANLFSGDAPPTYISYDLVKFNLGDVKYLTVSNQYLLGTDIYSERLYWRIFSPEGDLVEIFSGDLVEVPNGKLFIDYEFTDDLDSVYAYDITNLGWDSIVESDMYDIIPFSPDVEIYALAENVPYQLVSDVPQTNSLTEAWEQFNTYVTNYNTTHVIPEQLGDWLFETNGSKLFPCSVQVPTHIWYDKFSTTAAPDNHIWRWGGSLIQEEGFQYSLFDVVIVGESDSGYGIRYFYDDTLDPSYNYIDEMLFANLIDSFDVVIIVPESEGILYELPGVDVGPVGYTGSSSSGVVYTNDPLVGNTLQGFCILTERAIAKQQLWNFNDGITKLYELEVNYIDSEDKWKDSFLLWSSSVFNMLNSVDGHLNTIDKIISSWQFEQWFSDIKSKLDQLITNTGEFEWNFWYMDLFTWVNQFKPNNSDFAAGLEQFDNNWEDFPELPAPSTVPLLPTIGG